MRKTIFKIISGDQSAHRWAATFDKAITLLIVLNVIAIVLESYRELEIKYRTFFLVFEFFSVAVFSGEYLLRIWTSDLLYPDKPKVVAFLKFLFSPLALIDLMAILPFYLPFFIRLDLRFIRSLRLLRLLRILKLNRHTNSLKLVSDVLKETKADLAVTFFLTSILLIVASTLMYNIENEAQPESFENIGQAFWWAIATLTTIGYGDIYPVTGWGKLLSGIIALLGIGIVALPTGILSSAFMEKVQQRKSEKESKDAPSPPTVHDHGATQPTSQFNYCPHCGKKLSH